VDFIPAHTLIGEPAAPKLAFLLHGTLGSGSNLRSLATKLGKQRPEYRFCLVDPRHNGQSQSAPPPNTPSACAEDLARLALELGQQPDVLLEGSRL